MAVKYRLKKFTTPNSPCDGKYYAHAVMTGEKDIWDLAREIEVGCTLTTADVVGVITALVRVMTNALQDSNKVHLNGLGTFKMAIRGPIVDSPEVYDSTKIRGYHINFTPEYRFYNGKKRNIALITGAKPTPLK